MTPDVMVRIARYAVKELFVGPPKLQVNMQPPPEGRAQPTSDMSANCCACSSRPCACSERRLTA
jgi:hypothetical protein